MVLQCDALSEVAGVSCSAARPPACCWRRPPSTSIARSTANARFLSALLAEFSPHPKHAARGGGRPMRVNRCQPACLSTVTDMRRQELLRLNRAPGGTANRTRAAPRTEAGTTRTRCRRRGFPPPAVAVYLLPAPHTPARNLLEENTADEAVHEIQGCGTDLRLLTRRPVLRVYSALPDEPLIFVEERLMDRVADVVPVAQCAAHVAKPSRANTAVFYSISNCQPGLRGVPLGTFSIRRSSTFCRRNFRAWKALWTPPFLGMARRTDQISQPQGNHRRTH